MQHVGAGGCKDQKHQDHLLQHAVTGWEQGDRAQFLGWSPACSVTTTVSHLPLVAQFLLLKNA